VCACVCVCVCVCVRVCALRWRTCLCLNVHATMIKGSLSRGSIYFNGALCVSVARQRVQCVCVCVCVCVTDHSSKMDFPSILASQQQIYLFRYLHNVCGYMWSHDVLFISLLRLLEREIEE